MSRWLATLSEVFYAFFFVLIVFMRPCLFLLEGAYEQLSTLLPNTTRPAWPPVFFFFFFMAKCQGKTSARIHFVMPKPTGTHVLPLAHRSCYLTPRRWMSACAASSWMRDLNSANRPPDGNKHLEPRGSSGPSCRGEKWSRAAVSDKTDRLW